MTDKHIEELKKGIVKYAEMMNSAAKSRNMWSNVYMMGKLDEAIGVLIYEGVKVKTNDYMQKKGIVTCQRITIDGVTVYEKDT